MAARAVLRARRRHQLPGTGAASVLAAISECRGSSIRRQPPTCPPSSDAHLLPTLHARHRYHPSLLSERPLHRRGEWLPTPARSTAAAQLLPLAAAEAGAPGVTRQDHQCKQLPASVRAELPHPPGHDICCMHQGAHHTHHHHHHGTPTWQPPPPPPLWPRCCGAAASASVLQGCDRRWMWRHYYSVGCIHCEPIGRQQGYAQPQRCR